MSRGYVHVLLVEDNPGDVDLVRETLQDGPPLVRVSVAADGIQALEMLRTGLMPHLIFLDLDLPRKGGREVLREIRESENLKRIPVVVFTSSASDRDVRQSYELGANCYLTKPVDLATYQHVVGQATRFLSRAAEPS